MIPLLRVLSVTVALLGAAVAAANPIQIDSASAGIKCTGTTCFELRVIDDPDFSSISWDTSRYNAELLGGSLATPDSEAENEILLSLLVESLINPWGLKQFGGIEIGGWIGVSYFDGDWRNLDGSSSLENGDLSYPWYPTEPNGFQPPDSFVAFETVTAPTQFNLEIGMGWADLKCCDASFFTVPSFFIETHIPTPSTFVLFGLGLAGLGLSGRKKT